jgi:heat shock protein HtpX
VTSRNTLKTVVLLAGLAGLLVVVGLLIGGTAGALIGFALGLAVVGGSYWFSDRLAIRAAGAVPLEPGTYPWLHHDAAELSARAGIPTPRLYLSPSPQPNAFATGRNERTAVVAFTAGLLEQLPREQVRAVLAHELGHIRNRDILIGSVAAAIATGISLVANLAMWNVVLGGDDEDGPGAFGLIIASLLAPIAATMLQMAVSRSREFEADRTAAELIGSGEPLAHALLNLERSARVTPMDVTPAQSSAWIVNPLAGRAVRFANLFQTHPTTEQRVARLLDRSAAPVRR